MRYLILSDIHANREALDAVLRDAGDGYDRVLCCGDVVGYGADPEAAVEYCRSRAVEVVRGNHDKACAGLEDLEWFNPLARQSALWTLARLGEPEIGYLRELPQGPLEVNGCHLVHGSPLDEDEYVITLFEAAQVREYLAAHVTFFGHSHIQGGFRWLRRASQLALPRVAPGEREARVEIDEESTYLVNPGSVGQPRDRDPRAAYALYDPGERTILLRRVEYDVRGAQRKILEAGLPEFHAFRLQDGR